MGRSEGHDEEEKLQSKFKGWYLVLLHGVFCIGLSVTIAIAIDGYNAVDAITPRLNDGRYSLRVADITTLISAALVVIKLVVTALTSIIVWRCAEVLVFFTEAGLSSTQLLFVLKQSGLQWIRDPWFPKEPRSWAIATILFLTLGQAIIAPLLSGSINWVSVSVIGSTIIPVNSTVPTADLYYWYQFILPAYDLERELVRNAAAGFTNLAWSESSDLSADGTSLTGNGCRHVTTNSNGITSGSAISNITIPCLHISSIDWAVSADQIPDNIRNTAFGGSKEYLSLVNTSLGAYNVPGQALLFDANHLWDDSQSDDLPPPSVASGTYSLAIVVASQYANHSSELNASAFGPVSTFPQYLYGWQLGGWYAFANVTLTAGVVHSAAANTLSNPRVVEDQTDPAQLTIAPDPWTQNALWLLPDLITVLAGENATQFPTWNLLDAYVTNIVRAAYGGAWDALHAAYDPRSEIALATLREPRIQAVVSHPRVFAWLALSLLMAAAALWTLFLPLGSAAAGAGHEGGRSPEKKQDAKEIMRRLAGLDLF